MDTIERNELSVEEVKALCARKGILVYEPDTDEDKIDRDWQDITRAAQRMEHLIAKGVRLPVREEPWMLSYGIALLIRVAHSVAETAQQS